MVREKLLIRTKTLDNDQRNSGPVLISKKDILQQYINRNIVFLELFLILTFPFTQKSLFENVTPLCVSVFVDFIANEILNVKALTNFLVEPILKKLIVLHSHTLFSFVN